MVTGNLFLDLFDTIFYGVYINFSKDVVNDFLPNLFNNAYILDVCKDESGHLEKLNILQFEEKIKIEQDMFSDLERNRFLIEQEFLTKKSAENGIRFLKRRAALYSWESAISECNKNLDEKENQISFVSFLFSLGNQDFYFVLQLKKDIYETIPRIENNDEEKYKFLSFIDALRYMLFSTMEKECSGNRIPFTLGGFPSSDALIRHAGKLFVNGLLKKYRRHERNRLSDFYSFLDEISMTKYESSESVGTIFFVPPDDNEKVNVSLNFKNSIDIKEIRLARKMLELTTKNVGLLFDGQNIYGLGKSKNDKDANISDLIKICFTGFYKWEMFRGKELLLKSAYGKAYLPSPTLSYDDFNSKIEIAISPNINENQIKDIYKRIDALIREKKKQGALQKIKALIFLKVITFLTLLLEIKLPASIAHFRHSRAGEITFSGKDYQDF